MFGAGTKALFARYFQKDKSQFSQYTVQLIYTTFDKLSFLVFSYKLSNFLAIIDGYYICLSSDWRIQYNLARLNDLLSNICLVFYFYAITFIGGHVREFTQIIRK